MEPWWENYNPLFHDDIKLPNSLIPYKMFCEFSSINEGNPSLNPTENIWSNFPHSSAFISSLEC